MRGFLPTILLQASAALASALLPDTSLDERYLARRALQRTGDGTRYGDNCTEEDCWQDGACSFVGYDLPQGVDGSTCVSEDIWDKGAQCGGCIRVEYKGKSIVVMVTNKTGGDKNHLDMPPATWNKLTNNMSGGGVQGIKWHFEKCPLPKSAPIEIHMHGGASRYWFAATVQNASRRTRAMHVSADQGKTWMKAERSGNVNMFELSNNLSVDSVWIKVTSHVGSTVVVKNVELASGKVTKGTSNYK